MKFKSGNMHLINTISDFRNLGCEQQNKVSVAARVYQDLKLDKRYISIHKCYNLSLDTVYLLAQFTDHTFAMFLPLLDSEEINFKIIRKFQSKLDNVEPKKVYLAVCDTSSNILYYNIAEMLKESPLTTTC